MHSFALQCTVGTDVSPCGSCCRLLRPFATPRASADPRALPRGKKRKKIVLSCSSQASREGRASPRALFHHTRAHATTRLNLHSLMFTHLESSVATLFIRKNLTGMVTVSDG